MFAKLTDKAAAAKLDKAQYLKPFDIVWNSTGTGTIGRAAIVSEQIASQPLIVDSHVTIVRLDQRKLLPPLLHYWIQTPWIQKMVEGTGSTNQVELNKSMVLNTPVPVPPVEDQEKLVDRIGELFNEIHAGQEILGRIGLSTSYEALIGDLSQAILNAAFKGELLQ